MKLLFQLSKDCTPFVGLLKKIFSSTATAVALNDSTPITVTEVLLRAKEKNCQAVVTSNPELLKLLLEDSRAKLDDYLGSIIERKGVEFLILPPVAHIVKVPYGRFLYERYLSKLLSPNSWFQLPAFSWNLFEPAMTDGVIEAAFSSSLISCDIETGKEEDRVITCVGFTFCSLTSSPLQTATIVIPFTDPYNVEVIRTILSSPAPKVFQNGKYDNAYLLRFGCITHNYAFDTINLFHSWLSELPKDLGFISAFTLRSWQYWKNERKTTNLMDYYAYNAKDCFATAMSWLSLVREVPPYAWSNYLKEFPLVFPCLLTELTGLRRDNKLMKEAEDAASILLDKQLGSLRRMVSNSSFNPSSPKQVINLFNILGSGDVLSTIPSNRDRVGDRHPLNKRLMTAIENYREERKLFTTYFRDSIPKKEGRTKSWNSRIFYALNPHGTDTGRLASRESAFWCGWQVQNIPYAAKGGIVPDPGFLFGEVDYAQNEARGTAYLSGDTELIRVVEDKEKDFHGQNASKFFGVPYEEIVSSTGGVHKVIDKELRDLSKRTNHGSNYNMGPQVMLDTMGIDNVRRAQRLLGLSPKWSLLQVTTYLLEAYSNAYPTVKGAWYDKCINDVTSSGYLVGPTNWVRRCFGNPKSGKHQINRYVAHPPQSLGAMQLNIAYLRIYTEVALTEGVVGNFKLGPQVHDSVLFQYRENREDIVWKVVDCMRVPIEVTDTFGKKRTLVVPVDVKGNGTSWANLQPLVRK
jgi:DNA polymerase I-like protein with 3'-5' exonuclease and polymerase domains